MKTLILNLPPPEREFLDSSSLTILDWGCALGEGVAELARTFPQSVVTGLDCSAQSVEEARSRYPDYEFIVSEQVRIPRKFDVIVTSGGLENFEYPLAVMQDHLASCNSFYAILVPYNERPLDPSHQAQFRVESFPPCLHGFVRLHAEPIAVENHFGPGKQLLVVYGSDQYVLSRNGMQAGRGSAGAADFWAEALARLEAERIAERRQSEALLAIERRRFAESIQEFDSQLRKRLAGYRSQRAWRVMLALRKAYTLVARRKVRGIRPLLQWAVDLLRGRDTGLAGYELTFPDPLNFMPEELYPLVTQSCPASVALKERIPSSGKYDVIFLAVFDFECRFARPQQTAVQFARRGHRVFWISPSRFVPPSRADSYEAVQLRENLWEIHLRAASFDLYGGKLDPSATRALLDSLTGLYKDLGLAAACAILQFPSWRPIGSGLRQRFGVKLVYDCMDDWRNWPASEPRIGEASCLEETELARESDILVVTAGALRDRFAGEGVQSELIPNGADFDLFANAPANSQLDGVPRPVIGYFGAIAEWFDLDLMVEVAARRPQYSFVLIGEVSVNDIGKLKALPNVHLLTERLYRDLPGYLRQFDVCTIPFQMNQLTRAVDPVKVYEYLSQGKPVVSVPLPDLVSLSELLYFAEGAEQFASQIDCALAEGGDSLRRKRVSFAAEHTWASRVEALNQAVRKRFPLVSILIVTYNSREYIGPCLDSIGRKTAYPAYEVIVVDNGSDDGTSEELRRRATMDASLRIACLNQNRGFAGGNNIAAGMAKGEYLAFLNPDTIVTWGWLEILMRRLQEDPAIGLIAPVSNFSDSETKINTNYRTVEAMERFARQRTISKWGESISVEAAPLFCGLLPRKVWQEVGDLDEAFQVGMFEDDDFCRRIRKAGYRIVAAEDCFIHHFGHGSFGKLDDDAFQRIFEQNKARFEAKWGVWPPHTTRAGVKPIFEDVRVSLSEFFQGEGAGP